LGFLPIAFSSFLKMGFLPIGFFCTKWFRIVSLCRWCKAPENWCLLFDAYYL